jgi:hypothetical protein
MLDNLEGKGKPLAAGAHTETPWDVDAGQVGLHSLPGVRLVTTLYWLSNVF